MPGVGDEHYEWSGVERAFEEGVLQRNPSRFVQEDAAEDDRADALSIEDRRVLDEEVELFAVWVSDPPGPMNALAAERS